MGLLPRLLAVPLALAAVSALAPAPARACGGFFCDSVNGVPTPVDQTGENILFVIDRDVGTVEAHIQIEYTGDPQKFAWLIPVTAIPDFAVGSEPLITNLLAGSAPVYGFSAVRDCADDDRPGPGVGCASYADAGGDPSRGEDGEQEDSAGGPEVVKRAVVGAFELVVLQGGTSQEVYDWLLAGGFYQDMAALPILDEYLAEDFYFVAVKLRHDAGADEIHPITMTYAGDQPCVPLRLTRIAATEDMGVRVFSLGDSRTVPINYRHVELNEVRLDWRNSADNYREVVARAIDAPGADGHAFITEYAGPTSVVSAMGVWDPAWSSAAFEDAVPTGGFPEVMTLLADQGLVDCSLDPCAYNHPLILSLLRTYLPAPPGVEEDAFYACVECWPEADFSAWDGLSFANDFKERIDDPGRHAAELLNAYPYLTRLLTVISPEEMTIDPEFVQNPDLPEVGTAHGAVLNNPCEGSNKMVLPDEQAVLLTEDDTWPEFGASMPYAARVEQMTPSGAPQELAEFSVEITAALKESNRQYHYDNGRGIGCVVGRNFGRNNAGGMLMLGVVFIVAWSGRRRR